MTTMKRREFLTAAALTSGACLAVVPDVVQAAGQARTPAAPKPGYRSRSAGDVEILFKAPGLSGNGMQCTEEGIWTVDSAGSRSDTPGRCKVYLSGYDGALLRELSPEGTGPSGIGVDADHKTIWIASTYSREIIRADAKTGETISKHFTPGAGVIYRMTTDLPPRPDTYGRSVRPRREGDGATRGGRRGRQGRGPAVGEREQGPPGPYRDGTGAHGLQTQNGKLWIAVPPSRMIYRLDPETWVVEHMSPSVGNRPHGIGIETPAARHLWESDTNRGAFFKRDMITGDIVDSIELAEGTPFPHGMSVWEGHIYWVDDVGGGLAPVCRLKIER